jgi:hypothetical protein
MNFGHLGHTMDDDLNHYLEKVIQDEKPRTTAALKKLADTAQKDADAARICLQVCKDFGIDTKNADVLNAFKAGAEFAVRMQKQHESVALAKLKPRWDGLETDP